MKKYLIIILCVILCFTVSLSFQSCSGNSDSGNNTSEYDDTGVDVKKPQDKTEPVSRDTEDSTTSVTETQPDENTEPVGDSSNEGMESDTQTEDSSSEIIPDDTETETENLTDYPDYFEFNESGLVLGSIEDCEIVEASIGDKSFTLKEYFDDPKSYYEYFESYYKDLATECSNSINIDHEIIGFYYRFDDKPQIESLHLNMATYGIDYGNDTVMPDNPNVIDFSLNGISLGDSVEKVFDTLGDPHDLYRTIGELISSKNCVISYYFETGDSIAFFILEGKVSKIVSATFSYFN